MPQEFLVKGMLALRLDDGAVRTVTLLRDASGGTTFANVVRQSAPNDHFARKSLGGARIEDFVVNVATPSSSGLVQWIAASWGPKTSTRSGAVLTCAADSTIVAEQAFGGALISETTMPALDGSTKEPAAFSVRFVAATTLPTISPGGKLKLPVGGAVLKPWLPSLFRLEIAGLDCTKVSRIDGFTVRRDFNSPIDFPDLRIFVSMASAQAWIEWHKRMVIDGRGGDKEEKKGTIRLLGTDLKTELARIELAGLGIYRLKPERPVPDAAPERLVADLYCEQMTLIASGAG
jgi:hypothetical protein